MVDSLVGVPLPWFWERLGVSVEDDWVFFARSNGFRVAFEVCGDGPPLVLHPGMFQIGERWDRAGCTAPLASSHTVITIDPLGLGASDAPQDASGSRWGRRVGVS